MARYCPACNRRYDATVEFCPRDGTPTFTVRREDELVGKTIDGRFKVTGILGIGGMGAVYRATQLNMDREVALKLLRQDLAEDEQAVKRFLREGVAVSRLRNPHTITVFDFGRTEDGLLYLVMELLRGRSLALHLHEQGGPMDPIRAVRITLQVLESLAEAHAAGILHRDLKPDNVFLVEGEATRDFVKVLDFGIAKVRGGSRSESRLTVKGMVFGTPAYMSPEQALARPTDVRSDLYSVGVMLYEMLTGRVPFEAETPLALAYKKVHEPPPPIVLGNRIPQALQEAVGRLLATDAAGRPADAATAWKMLASAVEGLSDPLVTAAAAPVQAAAGRPEPTDRFPGTGTGATGIERFDRETGMDDVSGRAAFAALAAGRYGEARELLGRLLETDQDESRRARYHHALGILARDHLGDPMMARQELRAALDLNPGLLGAVSALDALLAADDDPAGLVELHEFLGRKYRQLGQKDREREALRRLAACYIDRVHDLAKAEEVLRRLLDEDSRDTASAARLADLLTGIPGREVEALEAHRALLALDPGHMPSYRAIRELCLALGDRDGAWCAASALVVLGHAGDADRADFESGRTAALRLKRDHLTADGIRRLIADEAADEGLTGMLAILREPLRALVPWRRPTELRVSERDLLSPGSDALYAKIAQAAAGVLGIPMPRLFRSPSVGVTRLALDPPALGLGPDVRTAWRGKELRFTFGRALACFLPGYELAAFMEPAVLRRCILAGLRVSLPDFPLPPDAADSEDLATALGKSLDLSARAELRICLEPFRRDRKTVDVPRFLEGVDRTTARIGFFLANDLEIACGQLAEDALGLSDLDPVTREIDLCAYAVSARYAELRRSMQETLI